ncbi:hypothetical protein [Streptomyces sp. 8N616]|uniref:hypothetical protein n=1 Tax=Streptomyces sp. 8N616 TaxID=3457414 RepID=UPI003FD6775D
MDSHAADVICPTVSEIEPTETQPGFVRLERGQVPGLLGDGHIALEHGLKSASHLGHRRLNGRLGRGAQMVQAVVKQGDELLLVPPFLG